MTGFAQSEMKTIVGSTEIWTRIAGFKVQSANHYTIEPRVIAANLLDTGPKLNTQA